jgi:hypothetical protein
MLDSLESVGAGSLTVWTPLAGLQVMRDIREELSKRVEELEDQGLFMESERLTQRTEADLMQIESVGFCRGIENYARFDRIVCTSSMQQRRRLTRTAAQTPGRTQGWRAPRLPGRLLPAR